MPALRRCLKRPELYLSLVALAVACTVADAMRSPTRQVTARLYVGSVRLYQHYGSPLTSRIVRCRYVPTCSEYSIQTVTKYGIGRGLRLSWRRVARCRSSVAPGTPDPVP